MESFFPIFCYFLEFFVDLDSDIDLLKNWYCFSLKIFFGVNTFFFLLKIVIYAYARVSTTFWEVDHQINLLKQFWEKITSKLILFFLKKFRQDETNLPTWTI